MGRTIMMGMLACLAVAGAAQASPARSLITVEREVSLEVLDWGGEGIPVILLADLGCTAHIFADFAPLLRPDCRVVALTRRGFGDSDAPESGYDTATLAHDVLAIADSLGLGRFVLAGHGIAGAEMTALALKHPHRVGALVYLDAAGQRLPWELVGGDLPVPTEPAIQEEDLASPRAVGDYLARIRGWRPPDEEIAATWIFSPEGRALGPATPRRSFEAVSAGLVPGDFRRLTVPCLAIFSLPGVEALFPWYDTFSGKDRALAEETVARLLPLSLGQVRDFQKAVPAARVVEWAATSHFMFLTRPTETAAEIRAFLAGSKEESP
ncbi:alpha/beta hydrolase [bacterium]|nr:alpha/beta hydrolase [bacterium]